MAAGEGGLVFFKGVAPSRSAMVYWMAHTQEHMVNSNWAPLNKRGQEAGRVGRSGADLGGVREKNEE